MNTEHSPFITQLLDLLLPPDLHHLVGDLEEEYHQNRESTGPIKARLYLWGQVLRSLPYLLAQTLIWNTVMLINYLKVTWRNIRKHKSFSLINILGLAASMSICLLIIVFVIDQFNYDQFPSKKDQIVRVITDFKSTYNDKSTLYATSPAELGSILETEYPEVEKALDVRGNFNGEFKYENKVIPLEGMYAGNDFLPTLGFKLIKGDPKTALKEPGSILLSPESAEKLFPDEEPIGKVITDLGDRNYTVTGIIDNDVQTHFKFEMVASYATLTSNTKEKSRLDDWKNSIFNSYTYLLMKKGVDLEAFETKIQPVIQSHFYDNTQENVIHSFKIQPLTDINMGPALSNEIGMVMPGFIVWFLIGFALIIILIASFNYVSLTIARSLNRGKEVGVRKVLGANKSSVVKQFLFEAIVMALLALLFSGFLLKWLLPEFNSLFFISFTNNQVDPSLLTAPNVIITFILFSLVIGLCAGFYPAMYLSGFSPSQVLKGTFNTTRISGQTLKKILTVAQFTFSIVFIITSIILTRQFEYMVHTDYGFNRENIVNVTLQDISFNRLAYELKDSPNIESISTSSKIPAMNSTDGVWLDSDLIDKRINAHSFRVDENYIQTMGLNLIAGRNFNPEMSTDTSKALIISDTAVEQLGYLNNADALNRQIKLGKKEYTIVGVIENFISADPLQRGDPIVLLFQPQKTYYAVVKTKAGKTNEFISELKKSWLSFNSIYSLKYKVFDDQLKENPMLIVFTDFIKILSLLAGFSILISCLGLLGMAMFSAENRVKEIGIRKVLGASISDIVLLLSKEYLVLIGIAVAIGTPLAWFINNLWMQNVTNQADIGPLVFLFGILGTAALALLTIGSQAIRTAQAKSIDNLKSE
jgi:putative ABC transport system permease protein